MNNFTHEEKVALTKKAIAFLRGYGTDHRNLKVDSYLKMDEDQLEWDHQWIQWAFPIDTVSPHNPSAGMIFPEAFNQATFKQAGRVRSNQESLVNLYFNSIGINFNGGIDGRVECDPVKFFSVVDSPYNHHVKRISRVFKHLVMTGHDMDWQFGRFMSGIVAKKPSNFDQFTLIYWFSIINGFRID